MRVLAFSCCLGLLVGCAKTEKEPAQDASAAPPAEAAAPAAPAPLSLSDIAGKWTIRTTPQSGNTKVVTVELVATGDPSGWTYNFPNRKPVPLRVAAAGDSIVTDAGPYESVIRKGVQVTVHSTMRLQDGKLVGTGVAHYATKSADSVVDLKMEGSRAP